MTFIFKSIPPVLQFTELIDTSLNKTQRQTPTVVHKTTPLPQIRRFYSTKIKTASANFNNHLSSILTSFPHIDNLHPFHSTLLSHLYNKDTYKIHLFHVSSTISHINRTATHFLSLLNHTTTLFQAKTLKKAALGKMANHVKKLKNTLQYLETIRQHMSRLPQINPNTRTILLVGHPNTGKSSFLNTLAGLSSQKEKGIKTIAPVNSYPFTTQNLTLAHFTYNTLSFQMIDTPGLLNSENKNSIELQTVISLLHLKGIILFFIDLSESCGYSVEEQIKLYHSVENLIKSGVVIVLSKSDLKNESFFTENVKEFLENKKYISVSTFTFENMDEIKKMACELLISLRIAEKGDNIVNNTNKLIIKGVSTKEKSLCCLGKKSDFTYNEVIIPEFYRGKNFSDFIEKKDEINEYLMKGEFDIVHREYDVLNDNERKMMSDIFNERKKRIIQHTEKRRSKLPEKWKKVNTNEEENIKNEFDENIVEEDKNKRYVVDILRNNGKEVSVGEKHRKEKEYRMKYHTSSKARHLYR